MAEKRTEEDKQNLAKIRVKNLLETYCYETKSRLKSSNIDSKQKAIIEKEIDKALNWVKNDKQSAEAIQEKLNELKKLNIN